MAAQSGVPMHLQKDNEPIDCVQKFALKIGIAVTIRLWSILPEDICTIHSLLLLTYWKQQYKVLHCTPHYDCVGCAIIQYHYFRCIISILRSHFVISLCSMASVNF